MDLVAPENYNIKTRIGSLLFDIHLDNTFRLANPPSRFNKHHHSMYEIHFITEGSGSLVFDNEAIELRPTYYYVIPPGIYHAIVPDRQNTLRKYTIRFQYMELNEHEQHFPANEVETIKKMLASTLLLSSQDKSDNVRLLQEINSEVEHQSLGYYTKLQSLINLLLINMFRASAPTPMPVYRIPHRIGDDKHSLVIDEYFDHYRSGLTLHDLAAKLRLSTRQTNRILQKMYHATFRQKLTDIRIEEGKELLKNSKDTITFIADQLGFSSS